MQEYKMKKYLPSKKFVHFLIGIAVLGIIFFLAFNFSPQKKFFFFQKDEAPALQAGNLTINGLIARDSDGDGVPDWEEALWGTDPHNKETFGMPDATYIANKKKALNINQPADNGNLNETEKFARNFFVAYTAMKTSGQVDDSTINNVSNALGQQISSSSIVDQYSEKDIQIAKSDTKEDEKNYYIAAGNLFEKYKAEGVGSELEAAGEVAAGGDAGDTQGQNNLVKISGAYQEFAQKLLLVPVPQSLADYALKIINSANNTGIAVSNMSQMMTDPVVGISGISQYEKYSDDLINSVHDLESFLATNGIIPESDVSSDTSDNSNLAPSDNTTSDTSDSNITTDNNSDTTPDNDIIPNNSATP
jgi:hypothetical protein